MKFSPSNREISILSTKEKFSVGGHYCSLDSEGNVPKNLVWGDTNFSLYMKYGNSVNV